MKKLIDRNREELEQHGEIHMRRTVRRTSMPRGGVELREVETPMLNEWQAVALLAHMLFVAVRRGETSSGRIDTAERGCDGRAPHR